MPFVLLPPRQVGDWNGLPCGGGERPSHRIKRGGKTHSGTIDPRQNRMFAPAECRCPFVHVAGRGCTL